MRVLLNFFITVLIDYEVNRLPRNTSKVKLKIDQNDAENQQCNPFSSLDFDDFELLERRAEILKTIGHPVRLKILFAIMMNVGNVTRIGNVLNLPQPITSRHLGFLKNMRIIEGNRTRTEVHYRIVSESTCRVLTVIVQQRGMSLAE